MQLKENITHTRKESERAYEQKWHIQTKKFTYAYETEVYTHTKQK